MNGIFAAVIAGLDRFDPAIPRARRGRAILKRVGRVEPGLTIQ
jgi:hypothetical protein